MLMVLMVVFGHSPSIPPLKFVLCPGWIQSSMEIGSDIWLSYSQKRSSVWSCIESILCKDNDLLLCVGDFNQVYSSTDCLSSNFCCLPDSSSFLQFLTIIGLHELQSFLPRFTWKNNREGSSCKFERLANVFAMGTGPSWTSPPLLRTFSFMNQIIPCFHFYKKAWCFP